MKEEKLDDTVEGIAAKALIKIIRLINSSYEGHGWRWTIDSNLRIVYIDQSNINLVMFSFHTETHAKKFLKLHGDLIKQLYRWRDNSLKVGDRVKIISTLSGDRNIGKEGTLVEIDSLEGNWTVLFDNGDRKTYDRQSLTRV